MSQPSATMSLATGLLSLNGRIGRREFTVSFLGLIAASILFAIGATALVRMGADGFPRLLLWNVLQVLIAWPLFALMVKRGHDRGRSVYWTLVVNIGAHLVPMALLAIGRTEGALSVYAVLAAYIIADYWLMPGDENDNRYGAAPNGRLHAHYVA